ncbi:hypothetical protein UC8_38650 [Roseimaritima ulvae]|uniref:Uncharacterized protein n=1 Tax=Roseimaritima ulvae TaxID=980254 RepID=A0A5B9QRW0_9BACT|nr:hypothetical protein UC8_38650 [Roseimaritima ulvae]
MIPLLIPQPVNQRTESTRPLSQPSFRVQGLRLLQPRHDSRRDEKRYLSRLVAWVFALLVVPAILTMLYIALNPDAFTIDITPTIDFTTWQPGQRP